MKRKRERKSPRREARKRSTPFGRQFEDPFERLSNVFRTEFDFVRNVSRTDSRTSTEHSGQRTAFNGQNSSASSANHRRAKGRHPMSRPKRRWRVQSDPDGAFDELVIAGHVHLEMMDRHVLWIRLGDRMTTIDLRTGDVRPWEAA